MTTAALTRSQKTNADIQALLRARTTLLWITTREELRVERAIVEAVGAAQYETFFWDCANGITSPRGERLSSTTVDPSEALGYIRDQKKRQVYIMRDLHRWWDPMTLRRLRNLARDLQTAPRGEARSVIVLTPATDVPPELTGHATVIDYPLPERAEIAAILDDIVANLPESVSAGALANGTRDAAIDAAVGLTAEEAAGCYARSMVTKKLIDPKVVSAEKQRVIARERVLTWIDPDPRGLDAIGGLEHLKTWLQQRRLALSQRAREYGLPAPKGVLLLGPPGTGKSATAKAVATAWGIPLLRLDMGALRSKYVGDSEANIRRALSVAEAIAPCVIWVDEIEKSLAGSTGSQGDGGVAADALGTFLSWMQERQGSVFVVATANDVRALPPELLRKGRFDEMFFVDLPTETERRAIVAAALRAVGRDPAKIEGQVCEVLAKETNGFTGAEIAGMVPDALFSAFADNEREVTTADLLRAAKTVVPLSKTAAERIDQLREWSKGRCRLASPAEEQRASKSRDLDI
jgi:SpoVK/Ycf46/Vps4 family AAA+-type ATPase